MSSHIWVSSDLQLNRASLARDVLKNAVEDIRSLNLSLHEAWCLGDALVGSDVKELERVAKISIELYESLDVPITYVMGNHETDLLRKKHVNRFPLFDQVVERDGWYTMPSRSHFYFMRDVLGHRIVFLGDHVAADGRWVTAGGIVRGSAPEDYPYDKEAYKQLRDKIVASPKPVIIASHYALQGGQRPSLLQNPLLPLSSNVRAHFHGHAHIGDLVWNKENPWQRINPIAHSTQMQFNISALETKRSPGSHSAVLTFHDDGSLQIRFRCHLEKRWIEDHVLPPFVHEQTV